MTAAHKSLDALREAVKRMTPGPWHYHEIPHAYVGVFQSRPPAREDEDPPMLARFGIDTTSEQAARNAVGVAKLRNAADALLDVVAKAEAVLSAIDQTPVYGTNDIPADAVDRRESAQAALRASLAALGAGS